MKKSFGRVEFFELVSPVMKRLLAKLKKQSFTRNHHYWKLTSNNRKIKYYKINNNNQIVDSSLAKYYQKKDYVDFVLSNETKFMHSFFWSRVHEHLINNTHLHSNGCKYKIC